MINIKTDGTNENILFWRISAKAAINTIAVLYIISSLIHIDTLIRSRSWYYDNFSYMPLWLINLRYLFSWLQRIFGIICAIGIFMRKEIFRKLLIVFNIIVVFTLYWKHPYPAFLKHTQYLDREFGYIFKNLPPGLSFEKLVIPSLIVHYLLDIAFCAAVIYTLSHRRAKRLFH